MDTPVKCGLAHEFYNQLTVITAHCDFLRQHCDASNTALKHLATISQAATRMAEELCSHECEMYELVRASGREKSRGVDVGESVYIAAK